MILAYGVVNGLVIALLALGFSLVYLPARVFNIALAGLYSLTPFLAWSLIEHGLGTGGSIAMAIAVAVGISLLLEVVNHGPLERKGAPSSAHLVTSLGSYMVIIELIVLIWDNESKVLGIGSRELSPLLGLRLMNSQIVAGTVSAVLLALSYGWLHGTRNGLVLRAIADNPTQASLYGLSIRRARLFAFGLSGCLGASAALLRASDVGFGPHLGIEALLPAVAALIIGGRDSLWGPLVGGLVVGILRSLALWLFASQWQEPITFTAMLFFLLLKPQGLVGRRTRVEFGG